MTKDEYKYGVVTGEYCVVCLDRYEDLPEGWDEGMDDLVGIPLKVLRKSDGRIYVESPRNGDSYRLSHEYLELISTDIVELPFRNRKLRTNKVHYVGTYKGKTLLEDYLELATSIAGNNPKFVLTDKLLAEISVKCPRILGVMLSNNIAKMV